MSAVTSQRRRRQACERCWKRKQKCDRLYPVCTACTGLDVECRERQFGIDASTTEEIGVTHASVISYVESLKTKISHSERSMVAVPGNKRRRTSNAPGVSPATESPGVAGWRRQQAPSTPDCRGVAISDKVHPVVLSGCEPSLQGTMGGIGLLSRSAMAEPHEQDTQKLPRNLTFENMTMAALSVDGPDPMKASLSDMRRLGMACHQHHPTLRLTRSGAMPYLEQFSKDVCFKFPFLDTRSLREQYDDIFRDGQSQCHQSIESCEDNAAEVSSPKALSLLTVYLAIATGALLSQESSRLVPLVNSLHTSAVKQLSVVLRNGDGLDIIHCILCLAIFSTYSPHGGSTWHLTGLAMTKCISLGLHKNPEPHVGLLPTASDYRRRLFWSAYSLDRSISTAMDRPFRIQDEDITLQLNNGVSSTPTPEDAVWHHLVIHARLESKVRANNRSTPLADYGNLCFWRDYPSELRAAAKSHRSLSDHLQQLACRTLIQMVPTFPRNGEASLLLSNSIREIERDAMESCKFFIDKLYERSHKELYSGSFVDAYDIIAACLTFVRLAYHPPSDEHENASSLVDAVEILQKCSTLITIIGERFSALRPVHRVLLAICSRLMTGSFRHVSTSTSASVITARSDTYPPNNGRDMNRQLDLPPAIPAKLQQLLIHTFEIS